MYKKNIVAIQLNKIYIDENLLYYNKINIKSYINKYKYILNILFNRYFEIFKYILRL